jgi:hypothetical protein
MRHAWLTLGLVALVSNANADRAKESMAVKGGRNYVKLLFESKAPPFVSEKQPVQVLIAADGDACEGIGSLRATKPEHMKRVKGCTLALQKRFEDAVDDVEFEDVTPSAFIASRSKQERAGLKKLISGLGISRAKFDIKGEMVDVHLAVAKDGRVHAIWIEIGAYE